MAGRWLRVIRCKEDPKLFAASSVMFYRDGATLDYFAKGMPPCWMLDYKGEWFCHFLLNPEQHAEAKAWADVLLAKM